MKLLQESRLWGLLCTFTITFNAATASSSSSNTPKRTKQFTFTEIPPSTALEWYPCETGYSCAMLDVPLDYAIPEGPRASVPLIKLAAKSSGASYRGMILTNPGGPGYSGVQSVLTYGSTLQTAAGTNFDIVAFDPRGIGNSIPAANCTSSPDSSSPFRRRSERIHGPKNTESYFSDAFSNAISLGAECKTTIGGDGDAGPHMTTATNVRDVISIVDAFSQTKEGCELEDSSLVNYWGLSYGTYIGETLAAMFPDRIGSVLLDGVVDPEDQASGLGLHSLQFTDEALSTFFTYCYLAGPSACSYYTGYSSMDIFDRFEKAFTDLNAKRAAAHNLTSAPLIELALESLKEFISLATYYPIAFFPILSDTLVSFETAEANLTADALGAIATQIQEALLSVKGVPVDFPPQQEWFPAVACSDTAISAYGLTLDDLAGYIRELEIQSVIEGESWATNRILCAGWNITSSDKFTGPFAGKTKNPILFVSNTVDPATPIYNSQKYVSRYEGARLLTVDGVGHTTISTMNSCAFKTIGHFFQSRVMPNEMGFCSAEPGPFNITAAGRETKIGGWDGVSRRMRKIKL